MYNQFSIQEEINKHDLLADELFLKFQQKFQTYEQIIFGVKGFIIASNEVEWNEWESYTLSQNLNERFNNSITLAYAPKITHEELDLFVNSVRDTFPNYDVHPNTENDIHYPLMYLSPLNDELENVLGFDMASEPLRKWCSEYSIDTGHVVLSDLLVLKEDEDNPQHSALMCMAVYDKKKNLLNVEDRRNSLQGIVTLSFNFNPMISDIIESGSADEFNLKIYDISDSEKNLMYDHATENNLQITKNQYIRTFDFNLLEKNWLIVIEDSDQSFFPSDFITILVIGSFISIGLYYFTKKNYALQKESKIKKLQTVEELSARLAHDLRNPLSVIQMTLENIFELVDTKNKEIIQSRKEKIDRAIFRITHQIESVLDFNRTGKVIKKPISLNEILQNTLRSLQISDGIRMILPKKDITIMADQIKMEIVFHNLIFNSIQAVGKSGLVTVGVSEYKDHVKIEVEDSGSGIPKKYLSEIFDPLFTTKQHGTGIGLATVKTIIESHDGTISVTSPPTIFTITLPKTNS